MSWLIRLIAFVSKEFKEILYQPRLIFGLVVSPFLILLLVGIGYRSEPRVLKTEFVLEMDDPLHVNIAELAQDVSPQLDFKGSNESLKEPLARLERQEIDLVIVFPSDPMGELRQQRQSAFRFFYNEIDPILVIYAESFGRLVVDEVNQLVVQRAAVEGQEEAVTIASQMEKVRNQTAELRRALENARQIQASSEQEQLEEELMILAALIGSGVAMGAEMDPQAQGEPSWVEELEIIRNEFQSIDTGLMDEQQLEQEAERVRELEDQLQAYDEQIDAFRDIPARLLLNPFRSEVENIAQIEPKFTDFFVSPVLAILLQHLAVTLSALSMVRDRQFGVTELYQVTPLTPGQLAAGKYLSHFLQGAFVAVALVALLIFGFRVPMLGGWDDFVVVLAGLIFTSLGIGFVISMLSESDSQAVQYSMVVLLASVFFSGLFFTLEALWWPVRIVSWLLPATYGNQLLQGIMLRGGSPGLLPLTGLLALGVLFMLCTHILLQRKMKPD